MMRSSRVFVPQGFNRALWRELRETKSLRYLYVRTLNMPEKWLLFRSQLTSVATARKATE